MSVLSASMALDSSAASGEEVIAIGDIHGCDRLLQALLTAAAELDRPAGARRKLIFLGDLIDRGPASLRCLDLAIGAGEQTRADEVIGLMGNHEQMLLIALMNDGTLKGDIALRNWIVNGGDSVLKEMPIAMADDVASIVAGFGKSRIAWLTGLVSHHISGEILAVHAGVNPHIPLDEFLAADWDINFRGLDDESHWAWIRALFLRHKPTGRGHHGFFVIHGHSTPETDLAPTAVQVRRSRLNLDGGTYTTGTARMAQIIGNQATLFETS